jgi:uncharacterized protein
MLFDWTQGELAEGLRCYRSQQFWHAHEHWESVWLRLQGEEKTFLQALIQTTAAFHHLQRKNDAGATSLMQGALRRLDPLPPKFGGIDVDGLRQDLRAWLVALDQPDAGAALPFPKILETTAGRDNDSL